MNVSHVSQIKSKTVDPNLCFCLFGFFLAQLIYALIGAGFGSGFLSDIIFPQFWIPWDIVKAHPWQSLFYYHVQSPLFAGYTFLFTLLFPPDGQIAFYLLHTLLGIFAIISLYSLQLRLHIHKDLATLLTLIYAFSPTFNLFASWSIYDFPTACLLLIATELLARLVEKTNWKNGFYFFLALSVLGNVRPLYHLILYFIPAVSITLWQFKGNRKTILLAAVLPFLLLLAPYLKNYYQFHLFSLNSWQGEVLSNVTMQWNLSLEERYDGIKKGYFSDLALCPHTADSWPNKFDNMAYTGYYCYDVISQKYRDTYVSNLHKDYSHIAILNPYPDAKHLHRNVLGNIGMSEEYAKNAIAALIHYPHAYFASIKEAWRLYFAKSPSYFFDVMGNPRHLPETLLSSWLTYHPYVRQLTRSGSGAISLVLLFMLPCLFIFGLAYSKIREQIKRFTTAYLAGLALIFIFYLLLMKTNFDWRIQYQLIAIVLAYNVLSAVGIYLLARDSKPQLDENNKIILFILCNILFTTCMINFLTGNEEQRYRFYLDGLFFILLGLFLQTFIKPAVYQALNQLRKLKFVILLALVLVIHPELAMTFAQQLSQQGIHLFAHLKPATTITLHSFND